MSDKEYIGMAHGEPKCVRCGYDFLCTCSVTVGSTEWIDACDRAQREIITAPRERIKALEECRNTLAIVYGERGDLNTDQWAIVARVLATIAALDKEARE